MSGFPGADPGGPFRAAQDESRQHQANGKALEQAHQSIGQQIRDRVLEQENETVAEQSGGQHGIWLLLAAVHGSSTSNKNNSSMVVSKQTASLWASRSEAL